ncbi:hypothetical protein C0995_015881 [Termitomyces sp. Mi166|nr:hypothetical protein C0995_015881 [Termitomyces sp. Mi166\
MLSSDYIIVGGGLTGTALAVRLSEDPAVIVTIIEAGGNNFHDEAIDIPGGGKGLGGSSLSETFTYKEEDADRYGIKFNKHCYGTSGPVQRTISPSLNVCAIPWLEAFKTWGMKFNQDPNDGANIGVCLATKTLDGRSIRSSSASAYYEPNRSRSNLKVITNALATRVMTSGEDLVIATGVEFVQDGVLQVIQAKKEVILCCGSFKTPQILELSGIGDPQVLKPLGIPVKVALPGVGNNLRSSCSLSFFRNLTYSFTEDHPCTVLTAKLKAGYESYEKMNEDPAFTQEQEEIFKATGTGMLVSSGLPSVAAFLSFKDFDHDGMIAKSVESLSLPDTAAFTTQREWVKNENVPFLEFNSFDKLLSVEAPEPGARYLTSGLILMHSFDRGSVHINSNDPTASPDIDLNLLSNETDIKILIKAYKILREIHGIEPFRNYIDSEVSPGKAIETDEAITEYLRKTVITAFHPIGTASMLPREDGGCVDNQLKVYGTANLRVVDASILPLHVSAHLQATLYAFAEKAADIIKRATNE